MSQVKWNDTAFKTQLQAACREGLMACAVEGVATTKKLLRLWSRPHLQSGGKHLILNMKQSGRRAYSAYTPSPPGHPPGYRWGDLHRSITHVWNGDHARYGSSMKKALWLERGTSRMPARPFLRPSLQQSLPAMQRRFVSVVNARMRLGAQGAA